MHSLSADYRLVNIAFGSARNRDLESVVVRALLHQPAARHGGDDEQAGHAYHGQSAWPPDPARRPRRHHGRQTL